MVEEQFASAVSSDIVTNPKSLILTPDVESEGNLCNITKTIPFDISVKLGILENIQIGQNSSPSQIQCYTDLFKELRDIFSWTYEDILGIDPSIVVHEIKIYPRAKLVQQKLRQVHPRKAIATKEEIEKLLKVGFIYPMPLTE